MILYMRHNNKIHYRTFLGENRNQLLLLQYSLFSMENLKCQRINYQSRAYRTSQFQQGTSKTCQTRTCLPFQSIGSRLDSGVSCYSIYFLGHTYLLGHTRHYFSKLPNLSTTTIAATTIKVLWRLFCVCFAKQISRGGKYCFV
jgi:hypothetical protein